MPIEVGGDPENIILEDVMPTGCYPTPSLGAKATRFPKGVYLAGLVKKQVTSHALAMEPTCCATLLSSLRTVPTTEASSGSAVASGFPVAGDEPVGCRSSGPAQH